jgi:hypothetical protein
MFISFAHNPSILGSREDGEQGQGRGVRLLISARSPISPVEEVPCRIHLVLRRLQGSSWAVLEHA